ncbi:unnamed protein product [Phaeothamnion confervicola]
MQRQGAQTAQETLAPLCVKDRRKATKAADMTASAIAPTVSRCTPADLGVWMGEAPLPGKRLGRGAGQANGGRPPPVLIEKTHIIRLASQYTPCAGCCATVKGLLERPITELRLLNAVVEEMHDEPAAFDPAAPNGGTVVVAGSYGRACSNGHGGSGAAAASCSQCRMLRLRDSYVTNRQRLEQLLESFPLAGMVKKLQPKGSSLRCETHRRNAGVGGGSGGNGGGASGSGGGGGGGDSGWEWEDAWERLPADLREKVATIDVAALEAAMHQATSTHRFCADCKHNVVTAFDVLTNKYDLSDLDNDDEFNSELFWPFANRVTSAPCDADGISGGARSLVCPLEEVEELICWHEDFDSREYTRSSQRHAATLEHGQREIRSIVGSVLLSQLRAAWHNHLAQVQGEQYLFCLVLHAVRTQFAAADGPEIGGAAPNAICAAGGGGGSSGGSGGGSSFHGSGNGSGWAGAQACPHCGDDVRPGCPHCGGTGLSAADLDLLEDGDDEKKKSKSRKKKEKKARAKARKSTDDEPHGGGGDSVNGGAEGGGNVGSARSSADGGVRSGARAAAAATNGAGRGHRSRGNSSSNSGPRRGRHDGDSGRTEEVPPQCGRRNSGGGSGGDYANGSAAVPAATAALFAAGSPVRPRSLRSGRVVPAASDKMGHAPPKTSMASGASDSAATDPAYAQRAGAKAANGGPHLAVPLATPPPPTATRVESERAAAAVSDPLLGGGSLLSMLDLSGDAGYGSGNDDGADDDLLKEMERLKLQAKSSDDTQRTREALRNNLQRNFNRFVSHKTPAA